MSKQCSLGIESTTESFSLEEVDLIPPRKDFALLKNGKPLYVNYYQAVKRIQIDILTADIFTSLLSKQENILSPSIFKFQRSPLLPEIQELNESIESWGYDLRKKKGIVYYLIEYPELIPIIQQASLIIGNYFPETPLALEIREDPEEGSKILMLYIKTKLSAEKAYEKLNEIDEYWWLEISREVGGYLCLHVEFQ